MSAKNRKSGNKAYVVHDPIVFCPKDRCQCLVGAVQERVDPRIRPKVAELGGEIIALEVQPDHVHLFVALTPDLAPHPIIAQVMGLTSRVCREALPSLLKRPSLWNRSYFLSTIGYTSDSVGPASSENPKGA
ncbi:MAG: IS200/IS605 family transposase [Armatimonadetes bacterium]|nr:IS200/IS605 family transposase [Armatimonadota bacterium]